MTIRARMPLVVAVVAALVAGSACVDIVGAGGLGYVEREEKRFSVDGKPDVALSTFDGSIEIRAWDRPDVLVVVEKRARDKEEAATIEVRAAQNGSHVTVDVGMPTMIRVLGFHWNTSPSGKLIVSMPASSDVRARSGDGSISIERITGTLDLRSGDGSIRGNDLAGKLSAHTGDGSIKLEAIKGGVNVDTGDGSVAVAGTMTSVRVRTGDGSVSVHAAPGSATTEDWDITTGDGSVTLELPEGFGGELDAHTGDGGIHLQDVTVSNVTGQTDKNSMRGRIGAGGHALRVRTGDGSITIRKGK